MYSIYADGVCIYKTSSNLPQLKLIDPKLTLSENSAGSLQMTVPPTNVGYSIIKRMSSEIVVTRNGKEIWSGRVLDETKNWTKSRVLYCEGELAYLNDTPQPIAEYDGITVAQLFTEFINNHNINVAENKQFKVGSVTVEAPYITFSTYTEKYESTMSAINNCLINDFGGYLRIRKENGVRYLDYLKEYPNVNSQTIEFGKNMLDLSEYIDMSSFATAVLPIGARLDESSLTSVDEYLTVDSVNNGSIYVISEEAYNTYGWICKVAEWSDITDPNELLEMGSIYLESLQFESVSLEVEAVDLHLLNVDTEAINILDQVRVKSVPHGMNRLFPVTNLVINIANPAASTFTLGTTAYQSFTSSSNAANTEINSKIEQVVVSNKTMLDDAKDIASNLITSALNGYVTILQNSDGSAKELLITSEANYTEAEKVWRWNINGLGYSSNGYNGDYSTAITMDGAIVGDSVKTGLITGEYFEINLDNGTFKMGERDDNGVFATTWLSISEAGFFLNVEGDVKSQVQDIVDVQVTDNNETVMNPALEQLGNTIINTKNEIEQNVADNYLTIEGADNIKATLTSMIEQSSSDITVTFTQSLAGVQNEVVLNQQNLKKYIRFDIGGIELGEIESSFKTNITNTEIYFSQDGEKIAYISNNKLYILEGHFINKMSIGNDQAIYEWFLRSNNHMTLKYHRAGGSE